MQREAAGEGEMAVDEGVDAVAATRYIPARGITHDRAGKVASLCGFAGSVIAPAGARRAL
jgi:hypothetical protein